MIRIAITEAFAAIAATLPLGSVAVEPHINKRGDRYLWLEDGDGGPARRDAATGAVASKGEARKP